MTAIVNAIEFDCPAEQVFAYLDELERHGEWQDQLLSVRKLTEGPTAVGTRFEETRRLGGREQQMTYEVTEHEPPRLFGFRGLDGPIRPLGRGVVEPLGDGSRCRLTLTLDFETSGMGKLMLPLVHDAASRQVVADGQRMKAKLEAAASG